MKRIMNINATDVVSPGEVVDIQLAECNPIKLYGALRKNATDYPLEEISWDKASNVWRVRTAANLPIDTGYQLRVWFNDANIIPVPDGGQYSGFVGVDLQIRLGDVVDGDNEAVTYSAISSGDASLSIVNNILTVNANTEGTETITVTATDSVGASGQNTITLEVVGEAVTTFAYLTNDVSVIAPYYDAGQPAKLGTVTDPVTGVTIRRMSDSSTDLQQSDQGLNGYSRWTQINSDGTKLLIFGSNSTSCTVLEVSTGAVVAYLAYDDSGNGVTTLGMAHEVRWDLSGNHPNRVYFRNGTQFFQIDDVTQNNNADRSNPTRSVIKDFESLITWPSGSSGHQIENDQEGDSSNDSDHWAFMATYYEAAGDTTRCRAFIHYQISTDTMHIMYPSDLAGAPVATFRINDSSDFASLDSIKDMDYFPARPNMVEISPLGTGFVIHNGRAWDPATTISGTWFDGPHLWPLDLDWQREAPFRISIDQSHSGWAFAKDGREMFVYQDNRRDFLTATYISGAVKGYNLNSDAGPNDVTNEGSIDFAYHSDLSWTGFHFGKMPPNRPGFVMVSTYSGGIDEWADEQLLMIEIKDKDAPTPPKILRIAPMYHEYESAYWDEATASMDVTGNIICVAQNWGLANGASNEVYFYELPNDWHAKLSAPTWYPPEYYQTVIVNSVEVV